MARKIEGPDEIAWREAAGRRLALLREIVGYTQEQMADLVRTNREAWSKWESGGNAPAPYKMEIICRRFKVSQDFIYRGTLFGVHPGIGVQLAARAPELVEVTKRILEGMGMPQGASTAPMWWLPLH